MLQEELYSIVLLLVPKFGPEKAKPLLDEAGSAQLLFQQLDHFVGMELISKDTAAELQNPIYLNQAEKILEESLTDQVSVIPYSSDLYPIRMRECEDAPVVLFFKGNLNLNQARVINMVGSRNVTNYGRDFIADFVKQVADFDPNILLVSGLAYGVDVCSHEAALRNGLNTVGVLAHGLDRIYPKTNRGTALKMINQGGLLTEFTYRNDPERYNFVSRNRIIAGISDATIIVESAVKGGSLLTADFASDYNRECFAVPGRLIDKYSIGCNNLIHESKASLLSSFEDVIINLGWNLKSSLGAKKIKPIAKRTLPSNLSKEERCVLECIESKETPAIDVIEEVTHISIADLHMMLFKLEMDGLIESLAGNSYRLL